MNKTSICVSQQNLFEVEPIKSIQQYKEKGEDDYIFDIVDALSAPILTFNEKWADTIPKRLLDIVPLTRMIALMQGDQFATYVECTIYIYTRTLEAPMDSEWVDIYTHVTCKTLQNWFDENHWEDSGGPIELNEWLLSKLNGLRVHIYKKRREILKERLKNQKQNGNELPRETDCRIAMQFQQSLFPGNV